MNEEDGNWELCGSCGEGVDPNEAFHEKRLYAMGGPSSYGRCGPSGTAYHPDCAGVWRCGNCGKWNEKAIDVCECGEKKE